jgi:ABC-type uncharacterized transport system YnjBCD substrate-binding protein
MARAAVRRHKLLTAPPSMCSGTCYWQSLARLLREENSQLRKSLLKARAAARMKPKTDYLPDDEPVASVEPLSEADLVELFERGTR